MRSRPHDDAMAELFRDDPALALEVINGILADGDHLEAFHAVAGGQADGEPHGRPDANRWLGEPA